MADSSTTILYISLIVVLIFIFILYWFERVNLFYPGVGASTPNIRSGRLIQLINIGRYQGGLPHYLGLRQIGSTIVFDWYSDPKDTNTHWEWLDNVNQCFILNNYGCGADYYSEDPGVGSKYTCQSCCFDPTQCPCGSSTDGSGCPQPPFGQVSMPYYFCSYCSSGGDSAIYTSISIRHPNFDRFIANIVTANPTDKIWNTAFTLLRQPQVSNEIAQTFMWVDLLTPANIPIGGYTVGFKNLPITQTGYNGFPSYMGNQIVQAGTQSQIKPMADINDDMIYQVEFVRITS